MMELAEKICWATMGIVPNLMASYFHLEDLDDIHHVIYMARSLIGCQ